MERNLLSVCSRIRRTESTGRPRLPTRRPDRSGRRRKAMLAVETTSSRTSRITPARSADRLRRPARRRRGPEPEAGPLDNPAIVTVFMRAERHDLPFPVPAAPRVPGDPRHSSRSTSTVCDAWSTCRCRYVCCPVFPRPRASCESTSSGRRPSRARPRSRRPGRRERRPARAPGAGDEPPPARDRDDRPLHLSPDAAPGAGAVRRLRGRPEGGGGCLVLPDVPAPPGARGLPDLRGSPLDVSRRFGPASA